MLEKIYADFTTHIAPKIAEGFVMGKDYFIDAFGRYVKYLIVINSLWAVALVIGACFAFRLAFRLLKEAKTISAGNKGKDYFSKTAPDAYYVGGVLLFCVAVGAIGASFANVTAAIKCSIVPEICVYDELFNNNTN